MSDWIVAACAVISTVCTIITTINTFHIRRSARMIARLTAPKET